MKIKRSVKMSEDNISFWKNLNKNCIKTDNLEETMPYSELQTFIVKYFKIKNDRYLELIELIGEINKNGAK